MVIKKQSGKPRFNYAVYQIVDGKVTFFGFTTAVSKRDAENHMRWRKFGQISKAELKEEYDIILKAAIHGSEEDIKLLNRTGAAGGRLEKPKWDELRTSGKQLEMFAFNHNAQLL